jgi:hypothetical protein
MAALDATLDQDSARHRPHRRRQGPGRWFYQLAEKPSAATRLGGGGASSPQSQRYFGAAPERSVLRGEGFCSRLPSSVRAKTSAASQPRGGGASAAQSQTGFSGPLRAHREAGMGFFGRPEGTSGMPRRVADARGEIAPLLHPEGWPISGQSGGGGSGGVPAPGSIRSRLSSRFGPSLRRSDSGICVDLGPV